MVRIGAAALLAGCGGSQPPIGAPGAMPQSRTVAVRGSSSSYTVLHSFAGKPNDGALPYASLIDVGGTLYGTTRLGGPYRRGTIFSIAPSGAEQVLYSFRGVYAGADGGRPVASLIDVNGTLYGTTYNGGGEARGVVFSVTTAGVEQILHRFRGRGSHGGHPAAALIEDGGIFYGTTERGGKGFPNNGKGTVFKITSRATKDEKVLHRFGSPGDGAWPAAPLLEVGGTFYGTTEIGGAYSSCNGGCGTVFSITKSGTETVLHSFGHKTDGRGPRAGLLDVNGTLYGTTYAGGKNNFGTVFSITTSGTEQVVYSFAGGTDGSNPTADLIDVDGTLYGTTSAGGATTCGNGAGCGTVFSIGPSGAETILHTFSGGSDGAEPNAALLDVGGVLYGTTTLGGGVTRSRTHCRTSTGCGTVFALAP